MDVSIYKDVSNVLRHIALRCHSQVWVVRTGPSDSLREWSHPVIESVGFAPGDVLIAENCAISVIC